MLYFNLCEASCEDSRVPEWEGMKILHAHMYGELSDLLAELLAGTRHYRHFKRLAGHRFGLAEGQLQLQFGMAGPVSEQSHAAFVSQLCKLLDVWVEAAQAFYSRSVKGHSG